MMDPDDVAMPERLELCYQYLSNNSGVVGVSGHYESMCMYGVSLFETFTPIGHKEIEWHLLRDSGNAFVQGASMIRKSVALESGGYNLNYELGEDSDLFLRMALVGRLENLPNVLLKYRQHPGSITHSNPEKLLQKSLERLVKAWKDRELSMDVNYVHPSVNVSGKEGYEYLLQWGWNALGKGDVGIARRYAKDLMRSKPFSLDVFRFIFCAIRGY